MGQVRNSLRSTLFLGKVLFLNRGEKTLLNDQLVLKIGIL
jgi:hypothetical protein